MIRHPHAFLGRVPWRKDNSPQFRVHGHLSRLRTVMPMAEISDHNILCRNCLLIWTHKNLQAFFRPVIVVFVSLQRSAANGHGQIQRFRNLGRLILGLGTVIQGDIIPQNTEAIAVRANFFQAIRRSLGDRIGLQPPNK